MSLAIAIDRLSHTYGERRALDELSLEIKSGEIFAFLGPNGSGKTTLFRVLSTLLAPQSGSIHMHGLDLATQPMEVRRLIGIVFQSPSLDKKLTVSENVRFGAMMYGISGRELHDRERELLNQLGIADRAYEFTEKLSGGLRRRVELAKGMIHRPRVLLLDEPSTGLDPNARSDLWKYLTNLRDQFGITIVLTTHFLDEAEHTDRIAILNEGRLVAIDSPKNLRASVGGETISIQTASASELARRISAQFDCQADVVGQEVRMEQPNGHEWVTRLVNAFPDEIQEIRLGKPTLEDVFIAKTGHAFWQANDE